MDITPFKQQMEKAVAYLESEFKSLQVGRATPALIENIDVEASYGMMKINQVGHITTMDNVTLKVECRDKNELKHVEKAIYDANIWLTPKNEWSYIMIKIPALTLERREQITKQIKAMGEDAKGNIRATRQDAMKKNDAMEKAKEISEDDQKRNEKEIDALTKSMNEKIDTLVKMKSEEVMKI